MTHPSNEIWRPGQTDPVAIPDTVLHSRLSDAIAWCRMVLDGKTARVSMRSGEIAPRILHDGRDSVVCEVGASRHWRVRATTKAVAASMPDLDGGRLLCHFPDADLCDGAAELASDGFFDGHNTPPWDTWVGYFRDGVDPVRGYDAYLLAYVPAPFVPLAERGVLVNPERCIVWLEDTDVRLRDRLSRASGRGRDDRGCGVG